MSVRTRIFCSFCGEEIREMSFFLYDGHGCCAGHLLYTLRHLHVILAVSHTDKHTFYRVIYLNMCVLLYCRYVLPAVQKARPA